MFNQINICLHLRNHHRHQCNEHIHTSQEFRVSYYWYIPQQPLICFALLQIILHFLEFYVSGIIQYQSFLSDFFQFSSVQFSRSVVSNSLRPHGSQHARPPCPSPSMLLCVSTVCSFLLLSSIPLYEFLVCLSTHLSVGI